MRLKLVFWMCLITLMCFGCRNISDDYAMVDKTNSGRVIKNGDFYIKSHIIFLEEGPVEIEIPGHFSVIILSFSLEERYNYDLPFGKIKREEEIFIKLEDLYNYYLLSSVRELIKTKYKDDLKNEINLKIKKEGIPLKLNFIEYR